MAAITNLILFRHLRVDASRHVVRYRRGRRVASARGAALWFVPMSTSLAEIPVDDREIPFLFHGRSSDFQDVSVQGVINLRVANPERLSERVDFSIDTRTGLYAGRPLEQLGGLVSELAQQFAWHYLASHSLEIILEHGFDAIREAIASGLAGDEGIAGLGVEIAGVRIVAVRPDPEVEKALRTPARESIQQRADEATFRRRALAVEKERAIGENELANQIELARREEELIAQRGDNEHRRVGDEAEARRIEAEAKAGRTTVLAGAEAERIRVTEGAKVAAEAERMAVYRDYPERSLMALAAHNLSGNLPPIEHLNVTPDLVGDFLNRTLARGVQAASAGD